MVYSLVCQGAPQHAVLRLFSALLRRRTCSDRRINRCWTAIHLAQ